MEGEDVEKVELVGVLIVYDFEFDVDFESGF